MRMDINVYLNPFFVSELNSRVVRLLVVASSLTLNVVSKVGWKKSGIPLIYYSYSEIMISLQLLFINYILDLAPGTRPRSVEAQWSASVCMYLSSSVEERAFMAHSNSYDLFCLGRVVNMNNIVILAKKNSNVDCKWP